MDERDLWAAVIAQAVEDLQAPTIAGDTTAARTRDRNRESARAWFKSDRNDGVGSFVWVCDALDYSPEAVREGVFGALNI